MSFFYRIIMLVNVRLNMIEYGFSLDENFFFFRSIDVGGMILKKAVENYVLNLRNHLELKFTVSLCVVGVRSFFFGKS